jgi:hypothetical protein
MNCSTHDSLTSGLQVHFFHAGSELAALLLWRGLGLVQERFCHLPLVNA